jgi:hypothetical protein
MRRLVSCLPMPILPLAPALSRPPIPTATPPFRIAVSSANNIDFTYDCSGNMVTRVTSFGTQALVCDAGNHLVEAKLAEDGMFPIWKKR